MSVTKISALTAKTTPAGTEELVINDSGTSKKITIANANKAIDIVNDTTPQLGGQLDVNGNSIGDGTLELLSFSETASAVNEFTIANAATGSGPTLSATGGDTDVDINVTPKGTGSVVLDGLKYPQADGTAGQILKTDGSAQLSWVTPTDNDTVYTHPTTDGNLHVPVTSTTNNGKVLTAGATAGSFSWVTPTDTNTQLTDEQVQDIVGAMLTGNTETNITVTYQDSDGTIDFTSTDTVYTHPTTTGNKHIPTGGATDQYLKYSASGTAVWAAVSGGATGAGGDAIFVENERIMTTSYTLSTNKSASMVGPLTINTGITLTIPTGESLVIL